MMMAWMALRSHMGVHDWESHLGTRAQGGGGRRAKPLLQGKLGREGLEGRVEMDSSSYAKPPVAQRAGGIRLCMDTAEKLGKRKIKIIGIG